MKETPVEFHIRPIPRSERVSVLVCDSAFDTSGKDRSQTGWLLGFSSLLLHANKEAPFSLTGWRSRKLGRKASSSMLCEALGLSKGSAELLWVTTFMLSLEFSDYDIRLKDRRMAISRAEKFVLRRDNPVLNHPDSLVVIDAKSLFDSLKSEQTMQEDRRAALEVAAIRDDLALLNGQPRWFPHNFNPSDALTKHEGAHADPLFQLLRTAKLCLVDEESLLELNKELKTQHGGYLPRIKSHT